MSTDTRGRESNVTVGGLLPKKEEAGSRQAVPCLVNVISTLVVAPFYHSKQQALKMSTRRGIYTRRREGESRYHTAGPSEVFLYTGSSIIKYK